MMKLAEISQKVVKEMRKMAVLVLAVLLTGLGCSNSPVAPTTPQQVPTPTVESSSERWKDYAGEWKATDESEEIKAFLKENPSYLAGGTYLKLNHIAGNRFSGDVRTIQGPPSNREARVSFENLEFSDDGVGTFPFSDDGWGHPGSITMRLLPNSIHIEIETGGQPSTWGIGGDLKLDLKR